jgi:four helix bundle protein
VVAFVLLWRKALGSIRQTCGLEPVAYPVAWSLVMRDHKKLRAFELADQLALLAYKQTRDFPREEVFGLTSQMRRAAVSVASNIVEGSARDSLADYIRFLDMANGSVCELEYQISLAHRLGYLPDVTELNALVVETAKVLNGLIRSLRNT